MTVLRHDWPLEHTLRRLGVDLVSHSVPPGRRGGIPSIAWIPDFQHVHLPQFFGPRERRFRDRHFRRMIDDATLVLLSSDAAAADLRDFRPKGAPKARVLRFVVEPPPESEIPTPAELLERYGLDGPFFLVANQFWGHKNHRVIVEALALLRGRGKPATVAATGDARDYRQPEVFDSLMAQATSLGVDDAFRVLGRVPYRDVTGLMRASTALINPSLFEGWNTGIEEAKSLGKRVIASDIDVHREQAPPNARYFAAHDAGALADAMAAALATASDDEDRRLAAVAAAELPRRRQAFAARYEQLVREALDRR